MLNPDGSMGFSFFLLIPRASDILGRDGIGTRL